MNDGWNNLIQMYIVTPDSYYFIFIVTLNSFFLLFKELIISKIWVLCWKQGLVEKNQIWSVFLILFSGLSMQQW